MHYIKDRRHWFRFRKINIYYYNSNLIRSAGSREVDRHGSPIWWNFNNLAIYWFIPILNETTKKYNQMASIPVQTGLLCSKLPRQFWWVEARWKYHHKPPGHERDWTLSWCTPHTPYPYTGIKAHSFFHS